MVLLPLAEEERCINQGRSRKQLVSSKRWLDRVWRKKHLAKVEAVNGDRRGVMKQSEGQEPTSLCQGLN